MRFELPRFLAVSTPVQPETANPFDIAIWRSILTVLSQNVLQTSSDCVQFGDICYKVMVVLLCAAALNRTMWCLLFHVGIRWLFHCVCLVLEFMLRRSLLCCIVLVFVIFLCVAVSFFTWEVSAESRNQNSVTHRLTDSQTHRYSNTQFWNIVKGSPYN